MKPINNIRSISRRSFLAAALAAGTLGAIGSIAQPVLAHEADCPFCSLPVVQDTDKQDNEVKLRYGRKRIEYRCVFCAISEAQSEYKDGDVTIAAPSEKKGAPIVIKREGGQWSAPAGIVFVAKKMNHKYCQVSYRVFSSRAAFDAYVKQHKDQLEDAKPLTLAEMVKVAG